MEEQLINFKTAKLAKEKGFDIETLHFYTKPRAKMFGIDEHGRSYPIKNTSKKLYTCGEESVLNIKNVIFVPTQSLLQKWLREVYKIDVLPYKVNDKYTTEYNGSENEALKDTYEKALELGLYQSLKLI